MAIFYYSRASYDSARALSYVAAEHTHTMYKVCAPRMMCFHAHALRIFKFAFFFFCETWLGRDLNPNHRISIIVTLRTAATPRAYEKNFEDYRVLGMARVIYTPRFQGDFFIRLRFFFVGCCKAIVFFFSSAKTCVH